MTPMWKIAAASFVGTAIEWYDFFLYGTAAALVFNKLFFPDFEPALGTLAALATFAAGSLARPLGAALFGHFGDTRSSSGTSLGFQLGGVIWGGFAPLAAAALVSLTGNLLPVSGLMLILGLISIASVATAQLPACRATSGAMSLSAAPGSTA